jgi:hypothetical protein
MGHGFHIPPIQSYNKLWKLREKTNNSLHRKSLTMEGGSTIQFSGLQECLWRCQWLILICTVIATQTPKSASPISFVSLWSRDSQRSHDSFTLDKQACNLSALYRISKSCERHYRWTPYKCNRIRMFAKQSSRRNGTATVHLLPWTTYRYLQILKGTGRLHKALSASANSEDDILRQHFLRTPAPM